VIAVAVLVTRHAEGKMLINAYEGYILVGIAYGFATITFRTGVHAGLSTFGSLRTFQAPPTIAFLVLTAGSPGAARATSIGFHEHILWSLCTIIHG